MASLTESQLVQTIRNRIESSIKGAGSALDARTAAWRQFVGHATGTEVVGRPTVQSMDVNSMVTAICAQMAVSFSTDTIATFNANDAEDEQLAAAESTAVNKLVVEDNGGFKVLLGGVQSSLLFRTGYIKVYWQLNRVRNILRIPNTKPEDLPILGESEEGIERRVISYNPKTGNASVEQTKISRVLKIKPVVNDRFFYDLDWDEADLADCPLCGEVYYKTRDTLLREGIERQYVDKLVSIKRNTGQEASDRTQQPDQAGSDPIGKLMEICRVYDAYVRMAMQETDDYAYLYRVQIGDGCDEFLTEPELVDMVPYACGSAFPVIGRHDGESLAEKLRYIQDGKTEMLRQWIENVRSCSYGRYAAVVGQVDADDAKNPVGGGAVRVKRPDAITPIPVIDVGASIKMALEEYDKMRTESGGAAVDMIGAEMQLAQDTAHGTERVYASKELLVSYMTRNLAESLIRGVYLLVHATLRVGEGGPLKVKVQESWQAVDPRSWPMRTHCTVKVGYSMGERMQISQALFAAIGLYKEALASGLEGQLVTKNGLYRMVVDWLTMQLVSNADGYFVDPASPDAQKAGELARQEADKRALETARQQAETLAMPERVKAEATSIDKDKELEFKYFDAVLDAQTKQAESETKGVIDLANVRAKASAEKRIATVNSGGSEAGIDDGGSDGGGDDRQQRSGKARAPRKRGSNKA